MKRKTLKKALSAFLSLLMCMMTLLSISTPVFAATTVDAYMVDFPRDGDSNYSATAWGHSATSLMGGWRFLNSKYTTVHSIGTYNGQVSYCIEPGIGKMPAILSPTRMRHFGKTTPATSIRPFPRIPSRSCLAGSCSMAIRAMYPHPAFSERLGWRALSHAIATQLLSGRRLSASVTQAQQGGSLRLWEERGLELYPGRTSASQPDPLLL